MTDEEIILLNIDDTVSKFINNIRDLNTNLSNICDLDNNYFLEESSNIKQQLVNILTSVHISELQTQLTNLKTDAVANLDKIANTRHTHEWIEDTIDVSEDRTMTICYCRKCEISKKV